MTFSPQIAGPVGRSLISFQDACLMSLDTVHTWWAAKCARCERWSLVEYAGTVQDGAATAVGNPPPNLGHLLCGYCGEPVNCSPGRLERRNGPAPERRREN